MRFNSWEYSLNGSKPDANYLYAYDSQLTNSLIENFFFIQK